MERAEKHTVFVLFFCFVCSSLHCLRYWSLSSNTISRASTSSYDYGSTISLRELNHQSGGYCFFISLLHSSLVHFLSFFSPFSSSVRFLSLQWHLSINVSIILWVKTFSNVTHYRTVPCRRSVVFSALLLLVMRRSRTPSHSLFAHHNQFFFPDSFLTVCCG